MSDQNTKELHELITQMRIDIGVIINKLDHVSDMENRVKTLEIQTQKITDSTSASHKRLDKIEEAQTWLWRSMFLSGLTAFFSLISTIVAYFITK